MPAPTKHKRAKLESLANYEPTSILITGGAGFIASHVVILLVENYPQYKVRGACFAIGGRCTNWSSLCPRAQLFCAN
jgi:hypothetical protein